MNLTGRPVSQKPEREAKNPAYLARVRLLTCIICDTFGETQISPTNSHHVIMGRGGNLKTPDSMAIPLCDGHHQGNFDGTKIAIHRSPANWREAYGEDRDYVAVTQDRLGISQ